MLTLYRLLSERSQVRLLPGARSEGDVSPSEGTASVAIGVANRPRKRRSLAACVGVKLGVNLSLAGLVLVAVMVAQIETPKESVQRPGLSDKDQAVLCETRDALRPDCPTSYGFVDSTRGSVAGAVLGLS